MPRGALLKDAVRLAEVVALPFALGESNAVPVEQPVELPITKASQAASETRQLTLTIAADGALTLDGTAIARDHLGERLESIFAGREDRTVFLAADKSLSCAAVVEVIDACHAAGVSAIGLVTQKARPAGA